MKKKKDEVEEAAVNKLTQPTNDGNITDVDSKLLGVLNITNRSIQTIPIKDIILYAVIPDFIIPTSAERPIIVKTPSGNFCIEGSNLINAALAEGESEIVCEVDEMETHSDAEILLRKAGMRSLTRGGAYVYAEMMRNSKNLMQYLMNCSGDLRVHGHGGKRFGEGFTDNKEDDARHILSLRLGKDRDTINSYLNHSMYLTDEALQTLIEKRAPKEFFVKVQAKKRIEIKNELGSDNPSILCLIKVISELILVEFDKFIAEKKDNKKTSIVAAEAPNEALKVVDSEPTNDENDDDDEQEDPTVGDTTLPSQSEATPVNTGAPITVETIKLQIVEVSRRIVDEVSKQISLADIKKHLSEELLTITKILAQIDKLSGEAK